MRDSVLGLLAPVRRRRQWQLALRALSLGMASGALASASWIVAERLLGRSSVSPTAWVLLLAGPVAGGLFGLLRRPSWQATATIVDDHCLWKDRTSAALEFSAGPTPSDFERLQVQDAVRRLTTLRPADIAPVRLPREWPLALGWLAVVVGLLVWPLFSKVVDAAPPKPFEAAVHEAGVLEEQARQIESAARELQSDALKQMAERMRQTIDELRKPGLDMRATMAKLSDLQEFIAEKQKEYDSAMVDQELQSLADAMIESKPLEPSAKALKGSQLEKAAQALEQARSATFDQREAQAVEPRLTQSAKDLKSKGLDLLSHATQRLAEGVKGNAESLKEGTRGLAKEIREHDRRKRINELMMQEQRRLQECKNRCEARRLAYLKKKQEEEGQSPQSRPEPTPGSTESDKDQDRSEGETPEETANRKFLEQLTGKAGDGPSEIEENGRSSDGGRSRPRRPSREVHQKYQRESEAVLDREPIPLGHRESIRRYFELIRPPAADGEPPSSAPEKGASKP